MARGRRRGRLCGGISKEQDSQRGSAREGLALSESREVILSTQGMLEPFNTGGNRGPETGARTGVDRAH